ncbi:MAG: hypothetical protein KDE20_04300 [Caldilineaceae bacterium]|nr:hypothetical protein [Caldilineaceae bacterium]
MSVQEESLETTPQAAEATGEAPEEEYSAVRTDSLVMFGAALGGALVGMLLTLMVLALINGGTLNFSGGARQIAAFEANLARINDNVGAISTNVDTVANQANQLGANLDSVQADLQGQLDSQGNEIAGIQDSLDSLDVTQQQFDVFMGALSTALTDMESVAGEAPAATEAPAPEATPAEAAPADSAPATDAVELPVPVVQANADLGPDSVVVVFFADNNGDGVMDATETNLVGMSVSLLNDAGESVTSAVSSDAGAIFEGLDAGTYQVKVDDSLGYELLSQDTFDVTLGENEGGVAIFIPVSSAAP